MGYGQPTGNKVGAHSLRPGTAYVRQMIEAGAAPRVAKAVDDVDWLIDVKGLDGEIVTIARFEIDGEIGEGVNGIERVTDGNYGAFVETLFAPIEAKLAARPELRTAVDYWEICNEPAPPTDNPASYRNLGELMIACMQRAERIGIRLGLLGLNAGTPEWWNMQQLVATGMFARARDGGHILTWHDGVFHTATGWQQVRQYYGTPIPAQPDRRRWVQVREDELRYIDYDPATGGAPPDGWESGTAGPLCFRYRFLYHLLRERGEVVPLVISEFRPGEPDYSGRFAWYEGEFAKDWYTLAVCPFSWGLYNSDDWGANMDPLTGVLAAYMVGVAGRVNGAPPDSEPAEPEEPVTVEATWEAMVTRAWQHSAQFWPANAALARAARADGFEATFGEIPWPSADDQRYFLLPAARQGSAEKFERLYRVPQGRWDDVEYFDVASPADTGPSANPLAGLRLGATFRVPFVVTSQFNAARDYGLHEGVDFDILGGPANSKEPVLCVYAGTVERVRRLTGAYCNYVVVAHEYNGVVFKTWYAHLDAVYVVEGQPVGEGQALGELGGTGGNWAEHVHVNLQVPGHGLSGYMVADVVDPLPYISMEPATEVVDTLAYLRGSRAYRVRTWQGPNVGAEEIFWYTPADGRNDMWKLVKNRQWEEFRATTTHIQRGRDTSEGNGRMYAQFASQGGPLFADWCPRFWSVGDKAVFTPFVQHYRKADCAPLNSGYVTNAIQFIARHARLTVNGTTFEDVIEIGHPDAERYWYARGVGMVQWGNTQSGEMSGFKEWVDGAGEQPEVVSCFA